MLFLVEKTFTNRRHRQEVPHWPPPKSFSKGLITNTTNNVGASINREDTSSKRYTKVQFDHKRLLNFICGKQEFPVRESCVKNEK